MSLDTVIKIGKQYRQAKDSWQYHDQVIQAIRDVDNLAKKRSKNGDFIKTSFYEIKVTDNGQTFNFDLDNMKEIVDEDARKNIYYLNFKANKKDSFKKYLVGDIIYSCYVDNKNNEVENGNYRLKGQWLGNEKSSFWKCEDIIKNIDNEFIIKFRTEFKNKIDKIEKILSDHESVALHFDFNGKSWTDHNEIIESINNLLCQDLVDNFGNTNKVVLKKYFYKTLGGCTPGFIDETSYKNRLFDKDEIISLLYANKATEKPLIRIGNIGILALPHNEKDSITPDEIVNFFERDDKTLREEVKDELHKEDAINNGNDFTNSSSDSLFADLIENKFDDKVKFDIIFTTIPSSPSGVFSDLIEISDIEKSLLKQIHENIIKQRNELENMANKEYPILKYKFNLQIQNSFSKIFGDLTADKKKFKFHLLKVIPQIYTDTYYVDPLLLPTFINKVEYNIRNNGQQFGILKYDFYFLIKIQKQNTLMDIKESKSYELGNNLGIMAQQFAAWREDCPIKSFEKNYVGNLSRRSSSLNDLIKFSAFINEKLVMHNRLYPDVRNAYDNFIEIIKEFGTEKYNKYNFALGFFETYYGKQKELNKNINE
jgi:hypothetical protein